ncbi:hypothetical protein ABT288_43450 [Streptomyces sp. NPDC001093]|uniref:hypothetical protein n=1 Tax=Streptomyces sp. NPDC001093 TaxID=3154376 RepID=UPI00333472D3
MSGFSRAKFPHWAEQGAHCDARERVLERDGTGVQRAAECRASSGRWTSVYDGKILTSDEGNLCAHTDHPQQRKADPCESRTRKR